MKRTACVIALMAGALAGAQDDPTVTSAAALLEQLKAAGVEIPEGFVVNEDGSVSLPIAEDAAAAVESAGEVPSPTVADAPSAPLRTPP